MKKKKKEKKRCQKSALQKSLAIYSKATTRRLFPRSQPRKETTSIQRLYSGEPL
jgi:hypothetical protein